MECLEFADLHAVADEIKDQFEDAQGESFGLIITCNFP